MGDSRWGDIFDVFTDDIRAETLRAYPVAVMLGQPFPENHVKHTLRAYAEAGGTVVLCAGQVGPDDAGWCGVAIEPELRAGRAWRWRDEPPRHEPFRYCPGRPSPDAEVYAATTSGDPLVTSVPLGAGRVITVLVPWYEGGNSPLCGVALRAFDELFNTVQPVQVDGPPAEWLSASGPDYRTVLVANHDGAPWQGTVTLRNLPDLYTTCRDIVTGHPIHFTRSEKSATAELAIPPFSVKVIRWRPE